MQNQEVDRVSMPGDVTGTPMVTPESAINMGIAATPNHLQKQNQVDGVVEPDHVQL